MGRRRTIDVVEIHKLKADGIGPAEIARRLGIGRASVYRAIGKANPLQVSLSSKR